MAEAPAKSRRATTRRAKKEGLVKIMIGDEEPLFFDAETSMHELTARDVAEVRKVTGQSITSLFKNASSDPDIDTMALMVFLARRQCGQDVSFGDVFDEFTYDYASKVSIEKTDEAAEDAGDSPEA